MIYPDGGRGWGNRDRFLRKAEWQRIVLDGIKSFACTGKRGEKTEVGNEKFPTPPIPVSYTHLDVYKRQSNARALHRIRHTAP